MNADPKQAHVAKELVAEAPLIVGAFDPKGRFLFVGAEDRSITRWDLASDAKVVFQAHDSWVMALACTPDGETLISSGGDDRLIWWPAAAEKPEPIRKLKAHEGWIRTLAISPDGKLLASGGNDRVVRVWRVADGVLVHECRGHERDIYASVFHPSGQWLITGDLMGKITQWEMMSGAAVRDFDAAPLHLYEGGQQVHYGGIRGLSFSPDGKYLCAGGLHKATNPLGNVQEPRVLRFDYESGKLLHQHGAEGLANHTIWNTGFLADGTLIGCVGGNSGHLLFWKPGEEKPFHKFDLGGTARGLALHPDGISAATLHHDRRARLIRLAPKAA